MTQRISTAVEERIDRAESADGALIRAISAYYDLTAQLEQQDRELFRKLDGAWVECLYEIRRVAWLDGWQCGRDPDKLVMGPADGGNHDNS